MSSFLSCFALRTILTRAISGGSWGPFVVVSVRRATRQPGLEFAALLAYRFRTTFTTMNAQLEQMLNAGRAGMNAPAVDAQVPDKCESSSSATRSWLTVIPQWRGYSYIVTRTSQGRYELDFSKIRCADVPFALRC